MSTRSLIFKKYEDGTFKGIYCHNDGYIDYNGNILYFYYNKPDRINRLIELGDLSVLGTYIEPLKEGIHKHFTFDSKKDFIEYNFSEEHSFDNPQEDVCVAYARDRGEELHISTATTKDELRQIFKESWCDYIYVFDNNKWYVSTNGKDYTELREELLKLEREKNYED